MSSHAVPEPTRTFSEPRTPTVRVSVEDAGDRPMEATRKRFGASLKTAGRAVRPAERKWGMQTPTRYQSPPMSLRRSQRLIQTCLSVPGISGLVTTYQNAVTTFEGHYEDWKLARRQASVALANQHEAEAALDEEVRGAGLIILKVSRGRRSSATYRNYFPHGYGIALAVSAEEALPIAAGILAAMADETNAEILARREPLEAARAALETACAARRAADDARARAKAVLEEAKFAWRNAHNDFYFAVRSFFPDRRKWVESLFKVNDRRESDDGGSEDSGGSAMSETPAIVPIPASAVTASGTPDPGGSAPRAAEAGNAT